MSCRGKPIAQAQTRSSSSGQVCSAPCIDDLALTLMFLAITQTAVKRQLTEEDALALNEGRTTSLHEKLSESGVVITGIELEDQQ